VDLARRRPGTATVLVRPRASLCGGTAPGNRSRSTDRPPGARTGRGRRFVRGHCAHGREDGLDPDLFGLHADARASRLDRRPAWSARGRGGGDRHRRPERSGRSHRAVRLLRRPHHDRRPGLRRSTVVAAGARGARSSGGHTCGYTGGGRNPGGEYVGGDSRGNAGDRRAVTCTAEHRRRACSVVHARGRRDDGTRRRAGVCEAGRERNRDADLLPGLGPTRASGWAGDPGGARRQSEPGGPTPDRAVGAGPPFAGAIATRPKRGSRSVLQADRGSECGRQRGRGVRRWPRVADAARPCWADGPDRGYSGDALAFTPQGGSYHVPPRDGAVHWRSNSRSHNG
jgi:hypothetical protein